MEILRQLELERLKELKALRDTTLQTAENIQRQINVAMVDWLVERGYLKKKWSVDEVEFVPANSFRLNLLNGVLWLTTRPLTLSKAIVGYLTSNQLLPADPLPIISSPTSDCGQPQPIHNDAIRLKGSRVDLWVRGVCRPDGQFVYEGWLEFSSLEDIKAMTVDRAKDLEGGALGWLNFGAPLYSLRHEVELAREAVEMYREEFEKSQEATLKLNRKLALMEETTNALKAKLA